jgi:hypothetical protein
VDGSYLGRDGGDVKVGEKTRYDETQERSSVGTTEELLAKGLIFQANKVHVTALNCFLGDNI